MAPKPAPLTEARIRQIMDDYTLQIEQKTTAVLTGYRDAEKESLHLFASKVVTEQTRELGVELRANETAMMNAITEQVKTDLLLRSWPRAQYAETAGMAERATIVDTVPTWLLSLLSGIVAALVVMGIEFWIRR